MSYIPEDGEELERIGVEGVEGERWRRRNTSEVKVRLDVYISKEVADALYEYIRRKYERPYGKLSRTVEEAIVEYLKRRMGEMSK